ncbi:putative membrane protein YfhO [Weissella uvarum]|uniref:YfhO family protein n=1 Tax=Weissella uvarum TaxID=1479233 RepID=UPI0019600B94|nr:YfhO family protein [Weissella uvarum]MBM7617325.1 putative membrane protein YfhO [Weissella uvarum]MCM0595192.1 YfhO family protein [Weissella uvarum]
MTQQQQWWKNNLLCYTAIFILLATMLFLPYFLTGTAFIWQSDGIAQHLPALVEWQRDLKHLLATHQWPSQWTFNIGLGSDFYQVFSYYTLGDIFTYGVAFVSQKHVGLYYTIMIVVRLFLAGIAFLTAVRHFTDSKNTLVNVIASIVYLCTGYTAFIIFNHPFFINPLIIFPLLITSLDNVLDGKKNFPFILMVAWTLWNNYYFAFMMALGALLFFIIQTSFNHKWLNIRYWANVIISAIIGALIPMVLFLPSMLSMLSSARSATSFANGIVIYPLNYYLKLPGSLIMNDNVPNFWFTGGFTIVAIFAAIYTLRRFKQYQQLNWVFIIALIMLCLPSLAALSNGASSPSNRWTFMLALPLAIGVVYFLNQLDALDMKDLINMLIFTGIAAVSIFYNNNFSIKSNFATMLAIALALMLVLYFAKLQHKLLWVVLALTLFNAFVLMHQNHENDLDPEKTSLLSFSNVNKLIDNQQSYLSEHDKNTDDNDESNDAKASLNRSYIENQLGNMTGISPATNLSILGPAHNVESYWSYQNGAVGKLMNQLQIADSNNNDITSNLDRRNIISNILGIKYWYGEDAPSTYVPYNNSASVNNQTINQSKSVYPLAYLPQNIISTKQFNQASGTQREAYLANGVVTNAIKSTDRSTFQKTVKQQPIRKSVDSDYDQELHFKYTTDPKNDPTGVYLKQAKDLEGTETHIELKNIKFHPASFKQQAQSAIEEYNFKAHQKRQNPQKTADLSYNPKLFKWEWYLSNISKFGKYLDGYTLTTKYNDFEGTFKQSGQKNLSFYKPVRNVTINIGPGSSKLDEQFIPFQFDQPGTYEFDVSVESIPTDQRFEKVAQAAQKTAIPLSIKHDTIEGHVKTNKTEILATTIPYSSGWSSKNQKLLKVNDGFLGMKLHAGNNNIQLNYQTPGLKLGQLLSIIGLVCLFIYTCLRWFKTHR